MSSADNPYEIEDTNNNEDADASDRKALVQWNREHWQAFRDTFESVRGELLRNDAALVWMGQDDLMENPSINEYLAETPAFQKKFHILLDCVDVNKAISPIREIIDQQIKMGKQGSLQKVDQAQVNEVYEYMETMPDGHCRDAVKSLFKPDAVPPELEDLSILRPILDDKPFNLFYVQDKIEAIVRKWSVDVFGDSDPALFKCKYGIAGGTVLSVIANTPQLARRASQAGRILARPIQIRKLKDDVVEEDDFPGKSTEELAALQEGREHLKHDHGEDPLDDSLTLAAAAKEKNKRRREFDATEEDVPKKRLAIEDALDEDDDEEETERAKLSELPKKKKRAPNTPRKFDGPPPDDGIYNDEGLVVRRRRWADEEKTAVKEGVKKYGVGHWVEIKKEYGDILRNRTSVQIKDGKCFVLRFWRHCAPFLFLHSLTERSSSLAHNDEEW